MLLNFIWIPHLWVYSHCVGVWMMLLYMHRRMLSLKVQSGGNKLEREYCDLWMHLLWFCTSLLHQICPKKFIWKRQLSNLYHWPSSIWKPIFILSLILFTGLRARVSIKITRNYCLKSWSNFRNVVLHRHIPVHVHVHVYQNSVDSNYTMNI